MPSDGKPIALIYLTEDQHLERMAQAIYSCKLRRITFNRHWDQLSPAEKELYYALARAAIVGCDAIRMAQLINARNTLKE